MHKICSQFVEILFDKAESTKDLSGDRARDYAVKKRKIAVEVNLNFGFCAMDFIFLNYLCVPLLKPGISGDY